MNTGISICIIARNESENITELLDAIMLNANANIPIEILLVDNNSEDNTVSEFLTYFAKHPAAQKKVIQLNTNNLGLARARAIDDSKYSVVAFIDADCRPPKNWLQINYDRLNGATDNTIIATGSGNYSPTDKSQFHAALNACLDSFWGNLGAAHARILISERELSHLPTCNVFYKKNIVQKIGNFSSDFSFVCEDLELSIRAQKSGLKFIYMPGAEVSHHHKGGLSNWAKKMYRYGFGQTLVAHKHPAHFLGIKGLPLLAALIQIFGLLFFPKQIIFFDILYLLFILFASFFIARKKGMLASTHMIFLIFITTHIFYALGELRGVFNFVKNRMLK